MGGWGSGAWQSGKDTTSAYRTLDVRQLARDGLLAPGKWFGWNWSREGDVIVSIQIRVGGDRVTLNYRARNQGEGSSSTIRFIWTGRTAASVVGVHGFAVLHAAAPGEWLCFTVAPSSPAVIVINWPLTHSAKGEVIVWPEGRTRFGRDWGGSPASSMGTATSRKECTGTPSSVCRKNTMRMSKPRLPA